MNYIGANLCWVRLNRALSVLGGKCKLWKLTGWCRLGTEGKLCGPRVPGRLLSRNGETAPNPWLLCGDRALGRVGYYIKHEEG